MSYALNIEFLNGVALARGETPNLSPIWIWDEDAERVYMATNGHRLFMAREQKKEGEPKIYGFLALDGFKGSVKAPRAWTHVLLEPAGQDLAILRTSKDSKIVKLSQTERPKGWDNFLKRDGWEDLTAYALFTGENMDALRRFIGDAFFDRPKALRNDGKSPTCWESDGKTAILMPCRLRWGN